MLRIHGRLALAAMVISAGLSNAEPPKSLARAADNDKVMTLTGENGKARRCQVLRQSKHPSGGIAIEVKDLETGEVMTVIENAPAISAKPAEPVTKVAVTDPILKPTDYIGSKKIQMELAGESQKIASSPAKYGKPPTTTAQRWFGKSPPTAVVTSKPAVAVVSPQAQAVEAVRHHDPVIRMIGALRDDMLPSMREVAAESLAKGDGRNRPEVIAALIEAAQRDLALSVRLCCVRCLAGMEPASPECLAALQGLASDEEEAVRNAAAEAMAQKQNVR
jgi:hypothetical protein